MNALVAVSLLLQQESAETAFQKIEAGIERAHSVRVLFTLTPASLPGNLRRGTMTLEGEAKAKLSADLRVENGSRISVWTEFENDKLRSSVAGHLVELKAEGHSVRRNFEVYLSRLGIFAGALFQHGFWSGSSRGSQGVSADLRQMFPLTNFVAVGDGSSGSKILKYSFSPVLKPMPFTWAKIWYDPKSYRLLRREQGWTVEGKEEVLIEEYEVQLDTEKGNIAGERKPALPDRSEAEQEVLFIQSRLQVATEHLKNGNKQKAIDVLEDLALSYPKHSLQPEIKRLLEEAKKQ